MGTERRPPESEIRRTSADAGAISPDLSAARAAETGASRRPAAGIETKKNAPKKKLETHKEALFKATNDALNKIESAVGNLQGKGEKVTDKIRGINSESTRILYRFTRDTLAAIKKAEANPDKTAAQLEVARLIKHFQDTLALWSDKQRSPLMAMLAKKVNKYEDIAQIKDEFAGVTEIMQNPLLSAIYVKVAKGAPLSETEIDFVVNSTSAAEIRDKMDKEGIGYMARRMLQVSMGPVLSRMKYSEKVRFAEKFIEKKGAQEFIQLAAILQSSGAIDVGQYADMIHVLGEKKLKAEDLAVLQLEQAKLKTAAYMALLEERVQAFKEAYKKMANDMRIDYDKNALEKTLTGGNIFKFIEIAWGSAVGIFNGIASYAQADGNPIEKLFAVTKNHWFLIGTGTAAHGALSGFDEEEKLAQKPTTDKKELYKRSRKGLIEIYNESPSLQRFLAQGGFKAVLEYNRRHQTDILNKEGVKTGTPESEIKITQGTLVQVTADSLIRFLKEEKPLNNSIELAEGLEAINSRKGHGRILNKQLNIVLKSTIEGRLPSQKHYEDFIADYRKNRDAYDTALA